jgi:hypothetical protein
MAALLHDLKVACERKPIMWVNLGGVWQKRWLPVALCIAMGDQKSQDYLCGRMSINLGNACRIHCWCMASVVSSSLISSNGVLSPRSCKPPPSLAMQRLNELA